MKRGVENETIRQYKQISIESKNMIVCKYQVCKSYKVIMNVLKMN